ncbi:MAG: hypothetical protein OXG25_15020 [Gammaproteobacteria bacterium]|nr:hypothetical protein [Gammaproteobacteria bacterium]
MLVTKLWLSFDLGTLGDYEGLFGWLDDRGAQECGRSVAALTFEYADDPFRELSEEIERVVTLDRQSRIYVVLRDQHTNKTVGRFIKGRRKQAPWTGYGTRSLPQDDYDEAV